MPTFAYSGKTRAGQVVTGERMAEKHQATGSEDVAASNSEYFDDRKKTMTGLLHHLIHYRRCALGGGRIPQVLSGHRVTADGERGPGKFGYSITVQRR